MYRIAIASTCLWAFSVGCGGDSSPTTTPASPAPAPAPATPDPPGVPTGLHVSARGAAFIEWTWHAVEGANGYDAQFSTNEEFTDADEVIARAEGELSYRREDLAASTSAYLRVRAASGTGDGRITSAWSDHVAGITAAPPPPPPATSRTSFGAGTWLVGADIEPGRYFTNPRDGCYWERLSGLGGTSDDRIANDFISFDSAQVIVDIDPSDVAFSTNEDCGTWDQSPVSPPASGTIPPGTWLVGQVESGRYFTNPPDGCYWERLSGLGGTSDDRISNDFISFDSAQVIVDIDPSDVAFSTNEDCGTWDQSPVSPPDAGTIPPGIWLVGRQVDPGVYEVDAGDGCYWERLSGFGGTSDDRIANDFVSGGGRQLVEIAASDVGFSNDEDCGTWRAIGSATAGLPGGTTASEAIEANRLLHEAHRDRHRH